MTDEITRWLGDDQLGRPTPVYYTSVDEFLDALNQVIDDPNVEPRRDRYRVTQANPTVLTSRSTLTFGSTVATFRHTWLDIDVAFQTLMCRFLSLALLVRDFVGEDEDDSALDRWNDDGGRVGIVDY